RDETSGPPELPGLSAASVWMTSSIRRPERARNERPTAEITPAVTVDSKPSGLPMATTSWPRRNFLESPRRALGRSRTEPARSSAKSVSASSPRERASMTWPSASIRRTSRALDDVAVGEHESIRRDYHAGTDASLPALRPAPSFHAHDRRADPVGDGHHGRGVGVENLRLGHGLRRGPFVAGVKRRCKIEHG